MELRNIPIDVICIIDKMGKLTPLKLRIENEDGSVITTKVNEIVYHKKNKYAGYTTFDYGCKVVIDEIDQLIELRYFVLEHVWKVNKIVWK